jgi:DNA-3-methyladenine glycosylase I
MNKIKRCEWCGNDPLYIQYHDEEWGKPVFDDPTLFEFLILEGFQAGLSNRLKIKAAVTNAQAFLKVRQEFGSFSKYIWEFVEGKPVVNHFKSLQEIPASTPLSDKISKDLKKRGFKFVGSTIVYAHMQATGMVNDHVIWCTVRTGATRSPQGEL